MSLTMCSASLPTPGRNPDDIVRFEDAAGLE
jgi:hypothetical protein